MIFNDLSATDRDQYPEELCRPNLAGRPFHRTPDTIKKYMERFRLLEQRAHRNQRADCPLELDAIFAFVVRIAAELSNNTWTQYRAACLQALRYNYDLRQIDDAEIVGLVAILDKHSKARAMRSVKPKLLKRTSAGQAKSISQQEQDAIHAELSPVYPIDGVLEMINAYGTRVGLRFSEWFNCQIQGTELIVKNAKYSTANRRGLAPTRSLTLNVGFCDAEICDLEFGLDRLRELVRRCGLEQVKKKLHARLRQVADVPSRRRMITFRTYRDQFRANLRADGHDRPTIAAAMGHSSADSQQSYGVTHRGRKGQGLATCSAELAAKVRPGANTTARMKRRDESRALDERFAEFKRQNSQLFWNGLSKRHSHTYDPSYTPFD